MGGWLLEGKGIGSDKLTHGGWVACQGVAHLNGLVFGCNRQC